MEVDIKERVGQILAEYDPTAPEITADALRDLWLRFDPKSLGGIKAEDRQKQETVGIPVKVLRKIGKEVGKAARKRVDDYLPLARLLWDEYGREGRVVAVYPLRGERGPGAATHHRTVETPRRDVSTGRGPYVNDLFLLFQLSQMFLNGL